ncbi:MAG: 1-(5-phosphoribosyl)-5-[(5-phosphoribosylamino)methylideneamino]imidazole-4-carboxamide isomerase [Planctomycetaceae bacterium]|nr:1-(5-phosphoribosyl)-5-[(5-phosphoribosylamino)methylideneamino]imidazole-4-carboxamide isomerase [Planctomycetaceae bacterium]
MDILPAIDLRGGKVVRLAMGDYDRQTVYSDDPAAVAREFAAAGATWIHIVDLDAARCGELTNLAAVAAIRAAVPLRLEVGGGARNDAAVARLIEAGADRVVIGSAALKDWPWFEQLASRPELNRRLALGLDAREGKLAVAGWREQSQVAAVDLAARVTGWPLGAIIYTDIARDGMLTGPNFQATAELIAATDVPVIASGGVSNLQDVRQCKAIGCSGAIIGKAYYTGAVDLAAACRLAAEAGK